MSSFAPLIATELNLRITQVQAVLDLFQEGATIPFIARYRKDKTGGLDEVQIQHIQEQSKYLKEFTERRAAIVKSISEQGKMTDTLKAALDNAGSLAALEDIYLPYKPKRRTKAQIARENGLQPLAELMLAQQPADIMAEAGRYVAEHIATPDDALQGARDIVAETINEDALLRAQLRKLFQDKASVQSTVISGRETEGIKYKDYFSFAEPVHKIPSHRVLAILRGFLEGNLRLSIAPIEEDAIAIVEELYVKGMNDWSDQLRKAARHAYRVLLQPSLESEFRSALKQKADEDAIQVFEENLRQLLLSAPLGSKKILAIDPGYRTGCKVVCLDEKGELQYSTVIYVHEPNRLAESGQKVRELVQKFGIQVFAIGDGTAGRETEQFIKKMELGLPVFMVNEDGASVYSASEIAREEFPDQDVTVRGSVSIGRRLMDPLAELVKIDPKSIGVGQYQHDVNQFRLKERLDHTVVSCVNNVGVNLNTASKQLLSYVSGIGNSTADNIVKYRSEIGKFTDRRQLLKVARLGEKAFEQSAGFLRIKEGTNPLDASAVHPEAYPLVERMAGDLSVGLDVLIGNESMISKIRAASYVSEQFGELTIRDILHELKKPGLDPRSEIEIFEFANIYKMEDVTVGMVIPGVVTNLTRFGAFVDVGVKQDGLVHVSEIANRYISDPSEALKLGQKVNVKVMEVDIVRKRIALSIKQAETRIAARPVPVKAKEQTVDDALEILRKKFAR